MAGIRNLPFYAPPDSVPVPLPTLEEIHSATEVLSDQLARKVKVVGEHFIVKYGTGTDLLEGQTMLYLQSETSVPVPRVWALFRHEEANYIIMERIHGKPLNTEWESLDYETKDSICSKLRNVLKEMRSLPSPGVFCSVIGGGLPDDIFWNSDPSKVHSGPFDTETALNEAIIAKYRDFELPAARADFYATIFPQYFHGHNPTFTHGDFQRKNVMIRQRAGALEDHKDSDMNIEVVIVDWESAGWYPSYWEYSRAVFACGRWADDWSAWVHQILEPAFVEYAWMHMMLKEFFA